MESKSTKSNVKSRFSMHPNAKIRGRERKTDVNACIHSTIKCVATRPRCEMNMREIRNWPNEMRLSLIVQRTSTQQQHQQTIIAREKKYYLSIWIANNKIFNAQFKSHTHIHKPVFNLLSIHTTHFFFIFFIFFFFVWDLFRHIETSFMFQ